MVFLFELKDKRGIIEINEPPRDKTNKKTMRPAKTQISLGIRPVWSESSPCAQSVAKGPSFINAVCEDSDQSGWMPRLIWVFAGRTVILLVLSWGGSYDSSTGRIYFTKDERADSLIVSAGGKATDMGQQKERVDRGT